MLNSPKFSPDLIFTKANLVGHTCMQEFELQQSVKLLGLNKRKELVSTELPLMLGL
jgi:hypothetical protein